MDRAAFVQNTQEKKVRGIDFPIDRDIDLGCPEANLGEPGAKLCMVAALCAERVLLGSTKGGRRRKITPHGPAK